MLTTLPYRRALALFFAFLASLAAISPAASETPAIAPEILESPWAANWIAHPTEPGQEFGVFHFRRSFDLDAIPKSFVIHVSADPRYRLFVNGASVSVGPAAGDPSNWRFETVDIANELRVGSNTLAATVWNFAQHRALAHHSYHTALIVQGNTDRESVVNTGEGWKVMKDLSYQPIPVSHSDVAGYFAASPGERFHAAAHPWGWLENGYDDSDWSEVGALFPGTPSGTNPYGNLYGWNLVPREIPPMEESQIRLSEIRRSEGVAAEPGFLTGSRPLEIPANTRAVLLLDQSILTNAYPTLIVSGGRDASLKLTYAESLRDDQNRKGNRNEIEGKHILGLHDLFVMDGQRRILQTLWLRTYRYLQLEIETSAQALKIHDLHGVFTGYPFEENGSFSSSEKSLSDIWTIGWRTARLNAFETYWDCPYYEQLQYIGDTRIQALISLYVSGDDRLMRKAIRHFDESRSPDGITMSRYPSRHPQYIPPYALLWIPMVHDYWMHRDDPGFVKEFLPGIRSVIGWYERHLDTEKGVLGPMPWWNYVDAAEGYPRGTPAGADDGNSIVISMQMLYALELAAELAEAFESESDATHYRKLKSDLRDAIRRHGWDAKRKLFSDTPDLTIFSQHANILAILSDALPQEQQADLMRRVLEDDSLIQSTYYFKFYLFRALRKAGLAERYLDLLDPWYKAMELGMTTFPEFPEPSRSDAHAWSSSPNYDFLATVAGVRPDAPGFASVLIQPHPGDLEWLEARVPHPEGEIVVKLSQRGGSLSGEVELPPGVGGRFVWNGREQRLVEGSQTIDFSSE